MNIKKNGIDVSEWQGHIDWEKVKSNIDFAIIRLGYGQDTLDSQATRNISECNRLSIPYGVYWFSYAYTVERVQNEARNAVHRLRELGGEPAHGVWFDWEYDSRNHAAKLGYTISNELLREMAEVFCSIVSVAGYQAGIYANKDFVCNYYGEDFCKAYPLWYAWLDESCDREPSMWQYSWSGRIAGIQGNVDMNYLCEKAEEENKEGFTMEFSLICKGDCGDNVKAVQHLLIANGYSCGTTGADGIYGDKTENAVLLYQEDNGLIADAIVGPKTIGSLLGY